MSDFDPLQESPKYEPVAGAEAAKPAAFCQNCGKALDEQTKRVVGPAVYCEPCLQARLGAAPNAAPLGGSTHWTSTIPLNWSQGSIPNPALAGLLGVIPGVGAMYNEQYAKGFFHLIVFVVLISLSHAVGIFGLFAFGWICYMVVEAHHTAHARRDGTPLPNPFGLNDLGERLGFSRAWDAGSFQSRAQNPPPQQPPTGWTQPGAYPPNPAAAPVPPATHWGAPAEAFDPNAAARTHFPAVNYGPQYGAVFGSGAGPGYQPPYGTGYVPPVPPVPPYAVPYAPVPPVGVVEPPFIPRTNRFPAGAVWLIGLGILFLLSTTGIFETLFGWSLVGFVLIGLAVWIFVKRMMDTGPTLGNDGSAGYLLRVVRALGPSVWIFATGVLLLLNEFDIVRWHRSWPLFIILAGVMALLQRAAYNTAALDSYAVPPISNPAAGQPHRVVPPSEPIVPAQEPGSHEGGL